MILGISSFIYGWSLAGDPQQTTDGLEFALLDKAASMGLGCVQICDNVPLHTRSKDTLQQLKQQAQDQKLRLEIGSRSLTEANFERYLAIAQQTNASLLRFVIDGEDRNQRYTPSKDEIIYLIRNFLPELSRSNIALGLENHDRFKSRELAFILDAIGSEHVGICLDTANSLGAGEGLDQVTEVLAPYTINLHIKDFMIERISNKMGFTVTGAALGTGMLDLPALMEQINQFTRCKSAVLEQWVPPQSSLTATRVLEDTWAENSVRYLKSLAYFN